MNKYIFLVVISKEKNKTNWDQDFCVGKLKNANQPSVAFKSDENENFAALVINAQNSTRFSNTYGDKLNDCVRKNKIDERGNE